MEDEAKTQNVSTNIQLNGSSVVQTKRTNVTFVADMPPE